MSFQVWRPLDVLVPAENVAGNLALIILNQPLEPLQKELGILWEKAVLKVAVDGGSERLKSLYNGERLPDLITGDLDSCLQDTLQYYKMKGVEIRETPDQDFTDFTKCLKLISDKVNQSEDIGAVAVLAAMGGRVDHGMANINTLFDMKPLLFKPVFLISDQSLVFLLKPGDHRIEVNTGLEGDWCSLIPIGQPCDDVTTTGLKWNLNHARLKFGELISTSNSFDGNESVMVSTSHDVIWAMGYHLK